METEDVLTYSQEKASRYTWARWIHCKFLHDIFKIHFNINH